MKVLKSWLKEYVDFNWSDQELSDKLSYSGTLVEEYYPDNKSDTIFDLEITPNRGDCVSHIGIAREVAALQNKSLKKEPLELKMSSQNASSAISVKVNDSNACPRYLARVINNVKVSESPDWLKHKLTKCGLKPINNIVDVTNYIMLDLGQPMHAFDLLKISSASIIVRKAKNGEEIKTLDGEQHKLKSDDLVIADEDTPIAVAGIIGGFNSQISNQTIDIVLEAAEFERRMIRASSKRIGIATDASYRFERGIDSSCVEYAINKAAKMMQELAGGTILSGIVKFESDKEVNFVTFDEKKINNLLGTNLSKDEIDSILRNLGFKVTGASCQIPSWRHDISIWQDLAEEVSRILGLNNIKMMPIPKSTPTKKSDYYYKEYLKDILASMGYSEVYTYSLLSDKDLAEAQLSAKDLLEIKNPMQPENKYLRSSIIPGLLKAVAKNPTFDPVLVFEIANIFNKKNEEPKLAVVASGKSAKESIETLKNNLGEIISGLKIEINEIGREELSRFKIRKPYTYVFEFSLKDISKKMKLSNKDLKLKINKDSIVYRPISKYPSLTRDLAFVIDRKKNSKEVRHTIYQVSESINRVELFDEFASDKLGKNKKNLAYHIYFQLPDRTMDDKEADGVVKKIILAVENNHSAKLRK